MDRLKGKTILIGREPERGRLMLAIKDGVKVKATFLGRVPTCVSRCDPAKNRAHCKIDFDKDGHMTITNLEPCNDTYVNGVQVASKRISTQDKVALGKDRFDIDISTIIEAVKNILDEIVSIKPLEAIWEKYENALENIDIKRQEKARKRLLPIIVGVASSVLMGILPLIFGENKSISLIGLIPFIITIILYLKIYNEKDTSISDRKSAQSELMDNYICPKCKHYLGQQPYKVLRQNNKCLYCHVKWTEEE